MFYSTIHAVIDRHVPLKSAPSSRYPSWYSKSLIKIISEKLRFHKNWKLYGKPNDYYTFQLLRKRQKRQQMDCYDKFIRKSEQMIKMDSKFFWSFVKSKKVSGTIPGSMFYEGISSSNGGQISD